MPGIVLPAAGVDAAGKLGKAVLQLLRPGRLQPLQNTVLRGDGNAVFLLQILRCQGLEKYQPPVSVGHGVVKLHSDPVFKNDYPDGALPHLPPGHEGQGVAAFLPDLGGLAALLEVVPEQPPPQPDTHGGKPADRHIQGGPEDLPVYLLPQGNGQPEHIAPALPLGGGIDLCRVIQPHPPQLLFPGEVTAEKTIDGSQVLPVLLQAVEHIGVPAVRPDNQPGNAPPVTKNPAKPLGITEQQLIPAREDQGGRHPGQVPQQRRHQRILRGVRVAPGKKSQLVF